MILKSSASSKKTTLSVNVSKDTRAYSGSPLSLARNSLLDTEGLQAIAVETDIDDLVPSAMQGAERGLHIFLDKPPGATLDAFTKLLNLMQQKQLVLQMGYMLRNNPGFEFMFHIVREGWLGRCICHSSGNEQDRWTVGTQRARAIRGRIDV